MIAWNALVLQDARHPAPLFNHHNPLPGPAPAAAVSQPLPPMRPGSPEFAETPPMAVEQQALPQAQPPQPTAPAPAAQAPRQSSRGASSEMIRTGGEPAAAAREAKAAQPAAPVRAAPVRDPIGDMIRMGGPVPTPPANVGRPDAGDLVLSGQRALARLGYSIKVDGAMGPGTRQAIEKFEQDHRLPMTGDFRGRTARELSTLSGIPVQ